MKIHFIQMIKDLIYFSEDFFSLLCVRNANIPIP